MSPTEAIQPTRPEWAERTDALISEMFAESVSYVERAGRLTVITSTRPTTQGKRLRKGNGGSIIKEQPDNLLEGHARLRFFETPEDVADILVSLTDADALSPQVPRTEAHPVRLKTIKASQSDAWAHTRSAAHFHAHNGRSVLVIDFDPAEGGDVGKEALYAAVLDAAPGLKDAGCVWWASSSSFVFDGERQVTGLKGQRLYFLTEDGTDTERVLKAINKRAWLAGRGRVEVSAAGSLLVRGLADEAMATAARLDYIGGSVCEPPLSQRRPRPEVLCSGGFVDTRVAVPDLSREEEVEYQRLLAEAKRDRAPEAERIRAERAATREGEQVRALTSSGIPDQEAQHRAKATTASLNVGELCGDFTIILAHGERVTVADLLADKERFDGEACRDPVEPEYCGGKVVAHINLSGREPNIYSHAHGGKRYALVEHPSEAARKSADIGLEPGALTFEGERGKRRTLEASHAATKIAAALQHRYGYKAADDLWYEWQGSHWAADGRSQRIARAVHTALEVGFAPCGFSASTADGILRLLQSGGRLDLALADGAHFLPFRNGLLDLRTRTLAPHNPAAGLDWCLAHDFDPEADCPTIKTWLKGALRGDEALVEFVRAAAAAVLTGRYDLQKFVYLRGRAGTGKGTFLRLLTAMMGSGNVHSTSLAALEKDQFETAAIQGKRLVIIADASRHGGSVETLLNLTGGDPVRLRRMHKEASSFVFKGVVVVASNDELVTNNPSSALQRRRLNVPFERVATEAEKMEWARRGGEEVVLHSELPGLVNWLLALDADEVASALRNPPAAVREANDTAEEANNHLARWMKARCAPAPAHVTAWGKATDPSADSLYSSFIHFCQGERVNPFALNRFKDLVRETAGTLGWEVSVGPLDRERSGRYGVRGLRLLEVGERED
ncbi:MAG: hypothetical protein J0M28_07730 [Thauera sp.]|nr:hypothetical protein [Thauera sp.]